MRASKSSDRPVFDPNTLRAIIGALAFAFPIVVIALTGKITSSISASYHEVQTRDVFVGFLFIIGALLISYKGHEQEIDKANLHGGLERFGGCLKRYQEDIISAIGGLAAIFTALFPTARDGYPMDFNAYVHTTGAFILFANVGYFSLIAFLRTLNDKLTRYPQFGQNIALMKTVHSIRNAKTDDSIHGIKKFLYRLLPETFVFLALARDVRERYDQQYAGQRDAWKKFIHLWTAYGKKIARGYVYVFCGSLIVMVLIASLPIAFLLPQFSLDIKLTFLVETISLGLFGIAWGTASRISYLRKIQLLWALRQKKQVLVAEPSGA